MMVRQGWCCGSLAATALLVASCATPQQPEIPAPPVPARSKGIGTIGKAQSNQEIRRAAEEAYGLRCLANGQAALADGRYREAIPLLTEALRYLGARTETVPHLSRAREALGEAYYQWALRLFRAGDSAQAAEYGRRAAGYGHEKAGELLSRISARRRQPFPQW